MLTNTTDFGVDADGEICDVNSREAVLRFERCASALAHMICLQVSEKDRGDLRDLGVDGWFAYPAHVRLTPKDVYTQYAMGYRMTF